MTAMHSRDACDVEMADWMKLTHRRQPAVDELLSELSGDRVEICALTGAGSCANNMLRYVAHHFANARIKPSTSRVDGHVMVMRGATVASRGELADLSTRQTNSSTAFLGAARPDYVAKMVITLPMGTQYMDELRTKQYEPLDAQGAAAIEELRRRVVSMDKEHIHVGVLLIELITADQLQGFSSAFLSALRDVTTELGIALVVDEIMTAIRCGRIFAYTYYPTFKPDFVTVGKGMLFCGVLSINAPAGSRYHELNGIVTSGTDEEVMVRAIRSLQVIKDNALLNNSVDIGAAIHKHLSQYIKQSDAPGDSPADAPADATASPSCPPLGKRSRRLEARHAPAAVPSCPPPSKRSNRLEAKRIITKDGAAPYVHGVACMWHTNICFTTQSSISMDEYGRLFPYISMEATDIAHQLRVKASSKSA